MTLQIRRLWLRNLRSYDAAEAEFPEGTTLVVGDVGSGKTSLLYAIEMALFGFAEVDPTYLVRHQAPEAEVRLQLVDGEHTYEFGRRFRRRTRRGREVFELESASYAEDGRKSSYTVTEIRERAIQLLGFPDNPNPRAHSDLWRWAVYIPQEKMREVLLQDAEERLQTVRKALGLEQYRTAAENTQLVAAAIRRGAESLSAAARARDHLVGERGEFERAAAERTLEAESLRRQATELAANAEGTERDAAAAEADRDRLEAESRRDAELGEALRAEETRARRIQERSSARAVEMATTVRRLEGAPGRAAELNGFRERLTEIAARLAQGTADRSGAAERLERVARWEGALTAATVAVDRARSALAEVDVLLQADLRADSSASAEGPVREPVAPTVRTIPELDAALRVAQTRLGEAIAQGAQAEQSVADLDALVAGGVCPRCHQSVRPEAFAAHRAEATAARDAVLATVAGLRDESERLEQERRSRERYERTLLRWKEVERERRQAVARRQELADRRVEADRRRTEAEGERSQAAAELDAARPAAEEARRHLAALTQWEAERATLDRQVADRQRAAEEDARLGAQVERLAAEEREAQRELAESAERRRALGAERAALAPRLAERDRLLERVRTARAAAVTLRTSAERAAREAVRAETLAESAERSLKEADRRLAERARWTAEAERRRVLAEWLAGEFRTGLALLERRLLARAQAEFERSFAGFFTTLVEDASLTARCDAAFSPSVEIDGEWTPAEALSGGERTALALAFRLALGGVVRSAGRLHLATLILDEPTDGFSPEQVLRMGELLERLALPQVLVVSHEVGLAAVADRVLRVEKRAGVSHLLGTRPSEEEPVTRTAPRRARVRSPKLDAAPSETSGPPAA